MTRRTFVSTGLAAAGLAATADSGTPSLLDVNYRNLVSRADLVYDKPAPRSEAGIPVGNGRMGTLVWTTRTALRFQINRADVYANSCASNTFNERNNDYCGGCAYLDIDLGADTFPASGFSQHLSLYDAALDIKASGVSSRILAWPTEDVLAAEINYQRPTASPVCISLRMLRYEAKSFGAQTEALAREHIVQVETRSHIAASQLSIRGDSIALTQEFREGAFCCKSAVVVKIAGRPVKAQIANESEVRLTTGAGAGSFHVLVSSAATFDEHEDVLAKAENQLAAAESKGFAALAQETSDWWHKFWSRSFVHLTSNDGEADFVEKYYTYFLYLMGASSRGKYPPKFNGMLWNTGGDLRTWGAQHWYANLSCYYEMLAAANRDELMDPMFTMYFGNFEVYATAARQQWGSQGIYIPETSYFDGLEKLPDEIAAEMRELYLMRKPWQQRSQAFLEYSRYKQPHSSRWNWIAKTEWVNGRFVEEERGSGPYGNVTHILGSTAKIAYYFWRRYEYTLDRDWLARRAYPMLKGVAEFYRNFPNVTKESDGKYHIRYVNSNESVWGARDTDEDLSSMRGVFPTAIRASEILGVDVELRREWQEFLSNLTPLPTSNDPDALKPDAYHGPTVWVRGRKPAVKAGQGLGPDGNSMPQWLFDLCNPESKDPARLEIAQNTLTTSLRQKPGPATPVGLLSKVPIAAATLGRSEEIRYLIPNQMRGLPGPRDTSGRKTANLENRMSLREGPQALDAEALGRASEAMNLALLQSGPGEPGGDPVIRIAPALPKEWNAAFTLRARGGFLVTSRVENGRVAFVELRSEAGARCRLRNPWAQAQVTLYRDGRKAESFTDTLIEFDTRKGEQIVVVPAGETPERYRRKVAG
jgi:hypothetical protein